MSSYYFAKNREEWPSARDTRDAMLEDKITEVWKKKGREVYGARKVWLELNAQGVTVARCTVERLMRDLGLSGVVAGRKRPRTTVPEEAAELPSDLLDGPARLRCTAGGGLALPTARAGMAAPACRGRYLRRRLPCSPAVGDCRADSSAAIPGSTGAPRRSPRVSSWRGRRIR